MEENCKRSQGSQRAVVLLKKKIEKYSLDDSDLQIMTKASFWPEVPDSVSFEINSRLP